MAYTLESEGTSVDILMLTEAGDFLLLETGDNIIVTESSATYSLESEPT